MQAHRLQEALEALDSAIAVNPQCVLAWLRKAETLEALGHFAAARVAYEQVTSQSAKASPLRARAERQLQLLLQKSLGADA